MGFYVGELIRPEELDELLAKVNNHIQVGCHSIYFYISVLIQY